MSGNDGALLYGELIPLCRGKADLYRGEDYELIFTVRRNDKKVKSLAKKFHLVGEITGQAKGYQVRRKGNLQPVKVKGYLHN